MPESIMAMAPTLAIVINLIGLIAIAVRLERRLTKIETNIEWLMRKVEPT